MKQAREETIRAKLVTPPKSGITQTGKGYINFDIEKGKARGIRSCTAWDSMVGDCDKEALANAQIGDVVTAKGFEGDTGVFVVKWFLVEDSSPDALAMSENQRIFNYYDGEPTFREYQREHFKAMEDRGMVLCFGDDDSFFFAKKDRCHKTGRYYRLKIDYVMDVLGAKKVNDDLSSMLPGGRLAATAVLVKSFPVNSYKEILDKLYKEAQFVDSQSLRG